MEASVVLSFSEDVLIGATRSMGDAGSDVADDKKNSYYIIGVVGAVVIALSFLILFASSKKLLCFKSVAIFLFSGSATPCASSPPRPYIFSDYYFFVHPGDRHLLAHAIHNSL
jgi:hypothetical protein